MHQRTEKEIHNQGKISAGTGASKDNCPFESINSPKRAWWLAGWHDWHIENKTGIME